MDPLLQECSRLAYDIAPAKPPETLIYGLYAESRRVSGFRNSDASAPKKRELSAMLNKIENAAAFLLQSLDDHSTYVFLNHATVNRWSVDDINETRRLISNLAYRAAKANINLPDDLRGRGRAYPAIEATLDARQLCALVIVMAWRQFHRTGPHDRGDALEYCHRYWLASGGAPLGKTDDYGGWVRWLNSAKKILKLPDGNPLRAEARRIALSFQTIRTQNPNLLEEKKPIKMRF